MKKHYSILFFIFILLFPIYAHAHPGATDENGGHYDYSTGEYHYHHGYPAHSHRNGKCLYGYDDRTGENSGTSSIGGYSFYTTAPRPTDPTYDYKKHGTSSSPETPLWRNPAFIIISFGFCLFVVLRIKWAVDDARREKQKKELERQKWEARKLEIAQEYCSKSIRQLSNMPPDLIMRHVDGKLYPSKSVLRDGERWGYGLEYYDSGSYGKAYHLSSCRYANRYLCYNAYTDENKLRLLHPCGICNPPSLPNCDWYHDYLRRFRECEEYGVVPKSDEPAIPAAEEVAIKKREEAQLAETQECKTLVEEKKREEARLVAKEILERIEKKRAEEARLAAKELSERMAKKRVDEARLAEENDLLHKELQEEAILEKFERECIQIATYYKNHYPKVWGYIQAHAMNPTEYVHFYHSVWGDLQKHLGNYILLDTLTDEQQVLIHYPEIGSSIFFSSEKTKKFHSTSLCYSLLKSSGVISRDAVCMDDYVRCTKCVPPPK